MIDIIGTAAGKVWQVLSEASVPLNITDIPKKTQLKPQVAYQAVGWLAREGKLVYEKQGQKTLVCLAEMAYTC